MDRLSVEGTINPGQSATVTVEGLEKSKSNMTMARTGRVAALLVGSRPEGVCDAQRRSL